jgi:hypothetical protein
MIDEEEDEVELDEKDKIALPEEEKEEEKQEAGSQASEDSDEIIDEKVMNLIKKEKQLLENTKVIPEESESESEMAFEETLVQQKPK